MDLDVNPRKDGESGDTENMEDKLLPDPTNEEKNEGLQHVATRGLSKIGECQALGSERAESGQDQLPSPPVIYLESYSNKCGHSEHDNFLRDDTNNNTALDGDPHKQTEEQNTVKELSEDHRAVCVDIKYKDGPLSSHTQHQINGHSEQYHKCSDNRNTNRASLSETESALSSFGLGDQEKWAFSDPETKHLSRGKCSPNHDNVSDTNSTYYTAPSSINLGAAESMSDTWSMETLPASESESQTEHSQRRRNTCSEIKDKLKTLNISCVDVFKGDLSYMWNLLKKEGINKLCVDALDEKNIINYAVKNSDNLYFNDTNIDSYVPVRMDILTPTDIERLFDQGT